MTDLTAAIGLVFVIEGAILSLLPEMSKKMMIQIISMPILVLRIAGLTCAIIGMFIIAFARGGVLN